MAVFTQLSLKDAQRAANAHGLPPIIRVEPIAAGSVNSNFFIFSNSQKWFFRIYEEQETDGVAYEWQLLGHLRAHGLPVPARVEGTEPGQLRVSGKPTAIFHLVGGDESCQAGVTVERAAAVGRFLADSHNTTADYGIARAGRFTTSDIRNRLDGIEATGRNELVEPVELIRTSLDEAERSMPSGVATGVVHGDLFRDNVRWDGNVIVAAIDWESASDGELVYDLAVAILAWCYGSTLDFDLAQSMAQGYVSKRPLTAADALGLRPAMMAAAARFATTRITDFYLREGAGERVYKDYRRFLDRLTVVRNMKADRLVRRLGL